MSADVKVCRVCNREGTQRFEKVGRGRKPWQCTNLVACAKRRGEAVTNALRAQNKRKAKDRAKMKLAA